MDRLGRALPPPLRPTLTRLYGAARMWRRRRVKRRWLSLRRTTPFSSYFGFDRGTPVDRVYIHDFLAEHAADIQGSVLEVADSRLAEGFGKERVRERHVLDVDASNPNATLVADLGVPGSLPAGRFDCFILTQTLQLIPDLENAVENAWRSLAEDGTLLITVPTLSRAPPEWLKQDCWRLTPAGLRVLLERCCLGAAIHVRGYGNVMAAAAFLYGLSAEELDLDRLRREDAHHPILACARVKRVKRRP
jgi:SAM-dependent methyltransferase